MTAKKVLVTGAASGIGLGIAEYLGRLGHEVVLTDVNAAALEEAKVQLLAKDIRASAQVADVTKDEDITYLAAQLEGAGLDCVINNAGIQHVSRLEDFSLDKWDLLIQIMLVGVARLTKAILPGMREKGFGRIINIGSIHSLIASPYKSAYVAAKHGLLGFSKVVALETADTDITINTVCPAYVDTPLVRKQIAAQAQEHALSEEDVIKEIMLKPMPKCQFISIEELAETCVFLMSEHARNITGQTIVLDGGWTAR